MDFSSHNPTTSNALSLAARSDDAKTVERLLKKMNPSCIDNRGWTSLHEAAHNNSYNSMVLILKHPECRPLAESHEGHTALFLACRNRCSIKTIKLLLDSAEDIANYSSIEGVTPLHIASSQGRLELIQLLLEYGAMMNVQDFDGDTPLHDAALEVKYKAVAALLHAGADGNIKNDPGCYTPFHFACAKGCQRTVQQLFPFISDIDQVTSFGNSPFMLAVSGQNEEVMQYLLQHGADPNIKNTDGEMAVDIAMNTGNVALFKMVFDVTDWSKLNRNLVLNACKPHIFKTSILEIILVSDLGPEFFDYIETFYVMLEEIGGRKLHYRTNAPLNSYLNICEYIYESSPENFETFFYLFLTRGVEVNPIDVNECPPLVYIHFCIHTLCFIHVFQILVGHGCNVDYCSAQLCIDKDLCIPDAFLAALSSDPATLLIMLPYSLHSDPDKLLQFAYEHGVLNRMSQSVQQDLLALIDPNIEGVTAETLQYYVPPLKHLCRYKIRSVIRNRKGGVKSTLGFFLTLRKLPIPKVIKNYLRYKYVT